MLRNSPLWVEDEFQKAAAESNVMKWIRSNLNPEDVFTTEQLADWATENGYVLREEQ